MRKHFDYPPVPVSVNRAHPNLNLTAAGVSIVAATYGLGRYCFGLFLPEIRAEFNLSAELVGLIAGSSYLGYLIATFAGSWGAVLFGPRLPIFAGGVAAATGMALIGLADRLEILALGVFVAGASPGLAYPPFSEVIVRTVEPACQNSVYSWINSGTGFGVALAGPLALYAGSDWRLAWLLFSGLAIVFACWNWFAIPTARSRSIAEPSGVSLRLVLKMNAPKLFVSAFVFGLVSSIYWTYAVDLLVMLTGDHNDAILFWIVLGVAGVTGCFAGQVVNRFGLKNAFVALVGLIGAALAILPVLAGFPAGIFLSAALFGAGFIVQTALFGIWSMAVFKDRPAIGFGCTFFLISLGQGAGPVLAGFLEPVFGLALVFLVSGGLCAGLSLLRPASR
ncbi:YbfB/YjiJ family MFS transporter [Roseibium sp. RKSG952]|uniref:YbfB/YjiJ family MFS transporter n=1 Tax=Roseibium sp. RKSG952 TaxID=2529384 RepID=UPI0012BBE007|nr:YbfB/YjiJ family MFS transporter [Roseibium sp. RKSG952]MTH96978.1 YbfB/YjiJ family MFS transporter [Roseibium sp. RKSG952]